MSLSLKKFQRNINEYFEIIQEQYNVKYLKQIALGLVIIICCASGYFLYRLQSVSREQKAFEALSEVIQSFSYAQRATQSMDAVKNSQEIDQAWQDVLMLLDALYKEHSSSYLAPYFLIIKSEILAQKNQDEQASLALLDQALSSLSKNSEIAALFNFKRIQKGLDSSDEQVVKKAVDDLIAITQNPADITYQQALYLLGLYFEYLGEYDKSQKAFEQLIASAPGDHLFDGPWIKQAQERIGQSRAATTQDDDDQINYDTDLE